MNPKRQKTFTQSLFCVRGPEAVLFLFPMVFIMNLYTFIFIVTSYSKHTIHNENPGEKKGSSLGYKFESHCTIDGFDL